MKPYRVLYATEWPMVSPGSFKILKVWSESPETAKAAWEAKHPGTHFLDVQEREIRPSRFQVGQIVTDRGFDVIAKVQAAEPAPVKILDVSDCGSAYTVIVCDEDGTVTGGKEFTAYDDELAPRLRAVS